MKTLFWAGVALLATVSSAAGQEEGADTEEAFTVASGFYVSARMGANLLEELRMTDEYAVTEDLSYKPGMAYAAAAGWKMPFFRAEFEVEYVTNEKDEFRLSNGFESINLGTSGEWYALSEFINLYVDLDNQTGFIPFLFAGAGLTNFGYDDITLTYNGVTRIIQDDSHVVFAWKLGGGVAWNFMDNAFLDLSYRYLKTDKSEGFSHTSHAATLGGRYQF